MGFTRVGSPGNRWRGIIKKRPPKGREGGGVVVSSAVCDVEVVEVAGNTAFARFDSVCRRVLGISGVEFVAAYKRGDYEGVDPDSVEGLSKIFSILPFAGL